MEDICDNTALDREFQKLTLDELQHQRTSNRSRISQIQNEISNLAFNNYKTYADVGRTAEHCKAMFTEVNQHMTQAKRDFPFLIESVKQFRENAAIFNEEYNRLNIISSSDSFIWNLLKLPKIMDECIRAGRYETAYALTNFAVNIKQNSKLIQNLMIKEIVDVLIEARHSLLDELFNKFAGPIDLAKSIQVVNNIRKIPYISSTQLRVSILQYRDIYLEKNVLSIMSEPDFLFRIIDVFRDCMYDTIVLYLAVFPDNTDFQRKYMSSMTDDDSRWERWIGSSQIYLLQSWAHRNIDRLFTFIRSAETKTSLDFETMTNKLMNFAFSFGRIGLDFRSLIVHEFTQLVVNGFRKKVTEAVKNLTLSKKLDLVDSDIFESTINEISSSSVSIEDSEVLSAPLELCVWDDICVFGNNILEAFNDARHTLSISHINHMFSILKLSFQDVFKWVDSFLQKKENSEFDETSAMIVRKAAKILLQYFVPFLNKCFFHCFSYEKCSRSFVKSHFTIENFYKAYTLLSEDLFLYCQQDEFFKQILHELNNSKTIFLCDSTKTDQIDKNTKEINQSELPKSLINESANEVADEIEQLLNQDDNHLLNKEISQNINFDELKNNEIIKS